MTSPSIGPLRQPRRRGLVVCDMKTLVLGASTNPDRYSNIATLRLLKHGHEVVLVGNREGTIEGNTIETAPVAVDDVDTVTLYLGPARQTAYYDYLVDELKPRRIIFNPGTENAELRDRAASAGIETDYACTLVMLGSGTF